MSQHQGWFSHPLYSSTGLSQARTLMFNQETMSLHPIMCWQLPPAAVVPWNRTVDASQPHGESLVQLSHGQILNILCWTWSACEATKIPPGQSSRGEHLPGCTQSCVYIRWESDPVSFHTIYLIPCGKHLAKLLTDYSTIRRVYWMITGESFVQSKMPRFLHWTTGRQHANELKSSKIPEFTSAPKSVLLAHGFPNISAPCPTSCHRQKQGE